MTTILKATSAAEFLALVPHLVGFAPQHSAVLLPFHGSRSLGAMRLDIPPSEASDSAAGTMIGMACRLPDADGVAVVIYTDCEFSDAGIPHSDLARALAKRADACGLRLVDSLCVAADGWGSYLDPDSPHSGNPLTELDRLVADLPPDLVVAPDQLTGAHLPEVPPSTPARTARMLRGIDNSVDAEDARGAGKQVRKALSILGDLTALFENALGWDADRLTPIPAAALIWCLDQPGFRDVALVQWASSARVGAQTLLAQHRWAETRREFPPQLGDYLCGTAARPLPERLIAGRAVARQAAAMSPIGLRPGPLAACAWLSWALGNCTHGQWYAEQALRIEPSHGLAGIVAELCGAGQLPDWAFERPGSARP